MTISNNKNQREFDSLVQRTQGDTARRVTTDPSTSALFNITVLIAQGNDLSTFMVNDFNEILFNDSGSLLTE